MEREYFWIPEGFSVAIIKLYRQIFISYNEISRTWYVGIRMKIENRSA